MKEIRKVPAFIGTESLLESALSFTKQGLLLTIEAARQIAKDILDHVDDPSVVAVLNIAASDEMLSGTKYKVLGEDMPRITLLEQVILIGIDQSQKPVDSRALGGLVKIQKKDADKAEYTGGNSFFHAPFQKVKEVTEGIINISPNSTTSKTNEFVFYCVCYFEKKFPWKSSVTV